ncbi:hormogonium polysaccharide secretion pseudopilin HpsB [Microcoleus vaginatus]|uniref:hormogonium polysaccharide secretion pseudopilin HpsB n=1 Tax=Microcoleus vaginatus TaxID=119532 RepID=UPI001F61F24C|nr:type II secretion system protein [Microcoleus vaginatus HSN003]
MIKRQQPHSSLHKSQEAGYTIIESLVAMIVVSVLMIAIAPVMAFSVATRVQAKRIEMATQAAKTYIEALRSEALKPNTNGFPAQYTTSNKLEDTPAPTDITALYCINTYDDINKDDNEDPPCQADSNQDFVVQGYYFNNLPAATNPAKTGYSLIVRVYRANSFASGVGALKTQKDQEVQKLQVQQGISTAGLGNLRAPLVEMRTEIGASDRQGAYNSLCTRINGGTCQ